MRETRRLYQEILEGYGETTVEKQVGRSDD